MQLLIKYHYERSINVHYQIIFYNERDGPWELFSLTLADGQTKGERQFEKVFLHLTCFYNVLFHLQ